MIKYLLNCYDGMGNDRALIENEDPNIIVQYALRRSLADGGKYTYRMETWDDNELIYNGFRFFENGKETTDEFKKLAMD